MSDPVTVIIPGDPVAFARTRINPTTGRLFNPPKQQRYSRNARVQARLAMGHRLPLAGPVRLDMVAQFKIAKSWPQKKKDSARLGDIRPTGTPDLSNVLKIIEDAFNLIVFNDDAQIVEASIRKVYGGVPQVVVTVQEIAANPLADMVHDMPNDTLDDMVDAASIPVARGLP